jgi:hypothetical protein
LAACLLSAATAVAAAETFSPRDIPDLEAWYETGALHRRSKDGDAVERWADASGRGHDLVAVEASPQALFRIKQLNGMPAVSVRSGSLYAVTDPFELADHTIFLVSAANLTRRALLQSDLAPNVGIGLHDEGRTHFLQDGSQKKASYNTAVQLGNGFHVTVLARLGANLRAFIDGAEMSSASTLATRLRVGRFFRLEHTLHVGSDGESLRIAEMLFFRRYLTEGERDAVTAHLAKKFGIGLAAPPVPQTPPPPLDDRAEWVRLSSRSDVNVNDDLVVLNWDVVGRMDGPFVTDSAAGGKAIHCRQNGTVARVSLFLPLRSEVPEARVRALILRNGREYLPEQALSSPFIGPIEQKAAEIHLQVTLKLDAGDYLEVVTTRAGAPGLVRLHPSVALLAVMPAE